LRLKGFGGGVVLLLRGRPLFLGGFYRVGLGLAPFVEEQRDNLMHLCECALEIRKKWSVVSVGFLLIFVEAIGGFERFRQCRLGFHVKAFRLAQRPGRNPRR
jgi:hypothetical protein